MAFAAILQNKHVSEAEYLLVGGEGDRDASAPRQTARRMGEHIQVR